MHNIFIISCVNVADDTPIQIKSLKMFLFQTFWHLDFDLNFEDLGTIKFLSRYLKKIAIVI